MPGTARKLRLSFSNFGELFFVVTAGADVFPNLRLFVNGWFIMGSCDKDVCIIHIILTLFVLFAQGRKEFPLTGSGICIAKFCLVHTFQGFR